jgi:hypothetical protein
MRELLGPLDTTTRTAAPRAQMPTSTDASQIAERGSMRLFMADIHLHRARLFRDKSELAKARSLIEACGYWSRKEELEDAEAAAKNWPGLAASRER